MFSGEIYMHFVLPKTINKFPSLVYRNTNIKMVKAVHQSLSYPVFRPTEMATTDRDINLIVYLNAATYKYTYSDKNTNLALQHIRWKRVNNARRFAGLYFSWQALRTNERMFVLNATAYCIPSSTSKIDDSKYKMEHTTIRRRVHKGWALCVKDTVVCTFGDTTKAGPCTVLMLTCNRKLPWGTVSVHTNMLNK